MRSRTWLPYAAVAVTLVFWSSAFVAIRHLQGVFSPGALSLGRLSVGAVALAGATFARSRGAGSSVRWPGRAEWPGLVGIGVLWFGVYNVALNEAERHVDAGTAAMLMQLSPLLIAVLAVLFLSERPTPLLWVGLALAFAGVGLIANSTTTHGHRDVVGVVLCLVAAAADSVSMVLQKPLVARLPAVEVTLIACVVGAVGCLPFAGQLASGLRASSLADTGWVLYLGVFPTAIAFTTWAFALSTMTASRLGVTTYLVPPLTVGLGWLFLSEVPPSLAYPGGVLCLVGVWLARRR